MNFNWLDVVIGLILLASVFSSVKRGFSREVIGLVAAFAALILGLYFYGTAGAWLHPYVSSSDVANFVGFLLVFVGVMLAGGVFGWIVGRFLQTAGLSWIDRALGAAFGTLRGLVMSVALVMILVAFAPGSSESAPPPAVVNSRLAPYVIGSSRLIMQFAPYEIKDEFHKRYDQVKHAWNDHTSALTLRRN